MKYKLVALDLDGTLLNNSSNISEFTKNTIKKLDNKGIHIIIATGRSYTSLKPKVKDLGITAPIICYNGAMIRNSGTDEIIMNSTVPDDISKVLIEIARRENIHFHGYNNGDFHYENISNFSKDYQDLAGLNGVLCSFYDYQEFSFTKCMFIDNNEKLLKIEKEVKKIFGDRCYIAFSKPHFLEIMNLSASKANALSVIAKDYGIKQNEIIAFGDGLNDLEMLEFAGKGIAMKNGFELLKSRFENTAFSNNEDGVAKYLLELLDE